MRIIILVHVFLAASYEVGLQLSTWLISNTTNIDPKAKY